MSSMLAGAIAMTSLTVSLFFLRFWKTTRDRFFLCFAAAFLIEGVERIIMGMVHYTDEEEPLFYIPRLVAFMIILYAIWDKNRSASSRKLGPMVRPADSGSL